METRSKPTNPDFSTLTGIMDHFQKVPFEQFKNDLDNWFKTEWAERRQTSANSADCSLPDNFEEFIKNIYMLAERKEQQKLN